MKATVRRAARERAFWRPRMNRRVLMLAAVPALAVIWVPGCTKPGPQAVPMTVVTINRATPIQLEGKNTDGTAVTFSLDLTKRPQNGRVTLSGRTATYTPNTGFRGTDAFGFTVTGVSGSPASAVVTVIVKRPNIVVVMSDDQTAEQQQWLPKTNTLIGGSAGTTFANAIVSYSECCPSRSTFLTGQYAHNHGVLSSAWPTGGVNKFVDDNPDVLAPLLQKGGYATGLAGKYLNGYGDTGPTPNVPPTHVPPGWSDWLGFVEPNSYNFFDYDVSDNGTVVHHGTDAADYSTDVVFDRAEQNIRKWGGTEQSFFQFVTPTAPHSVWGGPGKVPAPVPAPRHRDMFKDHDPAVVAPNNVDVADATMPDWPDADVITPEMRPNIDNIYRVAAESLQAVDEGVERLVNALKDKGELDNTLFVFTSDNGYHYGDHRKIIGKSDPYDETSRVPLLIRGPGFPAGVTARQPVSNIDLYPTLVAAAGATPGVVTDGVALDRFARNATYGATRPLLVENGPLWGRRTYKGVRDDRWTYIETTMSATGPKVYELYDRQQPGPVEVYNLYTSTNAEAKDARTRLEKLLRHLEGCAGTSVPKAPGCQLLTATAP